MKSDQLINDLLKQNEGSQLEFREVVHNTAIGKTICAFLNNDGGQLLIGINDKKQVIGVDDVEAHKLELEQFLTKEIVPEAPVMVSIEYYGSKKLLLIKVWGGSKQPYVFNGSIFFRRNNMTVQATSTEISELINKRQETELHWERQLALGVELGDLDVEEIGKTIENARHENKTNSNFNEIFDFLTHYGLYANGNFTNSAVVLFAKNPVRFIPQS